MENALKALIMAAGVAITCMLIAFGMYAGKTAKNNAADGAKALDAYETKLFENNYLVYEGATVSGSELINLLRYETSRKNNGEGELSYFEIVSGKTFRISEQADLKNSLDSKSDTYIAPEGAYIGETVWQDGILTALRFSAITK